MSSIAVLVLSAKVRPEKIRDFFEWQLQYSKAVTVFPGFSSSDVIPPAEEKSTDWTMILNFRSDKELAAWKEAPQSHQLADAARIFLDNSRLEEKVPASAPGDAPGTYVTEAIFSSIKPGMENTYREWTFRIQAAQAKYPGYRGMYLQAPASSQGHHWTTLLRYASAQELEAWMTSAERAELLKESKGFIDNEESMRFGTAFPGWIPVPSHHGKNAPPWKIALLVLLGLFPVVMLEIKFLSPLLAPLGWGVSATTFIGNALSVAVTSFYTVPASIRWFNWWLFPDQQKAGAVSLQGLAVLAVLFALEIVFFSWLLSGA